MYKRLYTDFTFVGRCQQPTRILIYGEVAAYNGSLLPKLPSTITYEMAFTENEHKTNLLT